jgi:hypothetical protein
MNKLQLINFDNYPKSNNKKITWTQKDNVSVCDLNDNCSKLVFKINDNDLSDDYTKIIFNEPILDKLPTGTQYVYENFSGYENFFKQQASFLFNYNYVFCLFIIVLIMIVILRCKKN